MKVSPSIHEPHPLLTGLKLPDRDGFSYQIGDMSFIGKRLDKWEPNADFSNKYKVDVYINMRFAGHFTFFISDRFGEEVIFAGMRAEPVFRGKGISKIFLKELFRIAHQSERGFIHAHKQRKPLMAALLEKSGFIPVTRNRIDSAILERSNTEGSNIYFFNPAKARRFTDSKIANGGNRNKIVKTINEVRDGIEVMLNTDYLLVCPAQADKYLNLNCQKK